VIYQIRHVTTYSYDAPVSVAACTLRLTPLDAAPQKLLKSELEITPRATRQAERVGADGMKTVVLSIETPHKELRIEARSRVEVERRLPQAPGADASWEDVRDAAFRTTDGSLSSPVYYLFPSRLVPLPEALSAYARASFHQGRDVLEAAAELMARIKADFAYDRRATQVSTPLKEAFERRRGVCQDFAHVMIAGLRGLGLPAAYVSGYLRTRPAPGRRRLEGADATHAWVDLWCGPDVGWVGLDPTNAMLVENEHIVLGAGRDYADVSPIDGIIRGGGEQELKVAVDVVALT